MNKCCQKTMKVVGITLACFESDRFTNQLLKHNPIVTNYLQLKTTLYLRNKF